MIDKSYDIGANRFGLFFCNSDRFNRAVNSIIEGTRPATDLTTLVGMYVKSGGAIVDFDQVDGLKLKDLQRFDQVNNNCLVFTLYDRVLGLNYSMDTTSFVTIKNCTMFLYGSADLDKSVDEFIANFFVSYFDILPIEEQESAKCFLQRYMYGTKAATDKAIQKKK